MYKAVVVRFETNGGTPVSPMTIEYGFMIHVPDSTKMGYSFSGWCKDSELKVSFESLVNYRHRCRISCHISLYLLPRIPHQEQPRPQQ